MTELQIQKVFSWISEEIYSLSHSPYYPYVGGALLVFLFLLLIRRVIARKNVFQKQLAPSRLEKQGNLREAADTYFGQGKYAKAAQLYIKLGLFRHAAECYQQMGEMNTAASLYARAGDVKSAVEIYTSLKMYNEALELLENEGKFYEAGELAARINQPLLAAEFFEKAGLIEQAGMYYFQAGEFARASRTLGKVYAEMKREGNVNKLIAQRYAVSLEKTGEHLLAGRVWASIDEQKRAAEAFEKAGEFEVAAGIYEKMGMVDHANELRRLAGAKSSALSADTLETQSVEGSVKVEEGVLKAKEGTDGGTEALLLLKQGRLKEAAEKFAEGGYYLRSAQIYQRLGEPVMQSQMLFRAGKYYEAVLNLYEHGNLREAEEMAKAVPESSPDFRRVNLIRADILFERGDLKEAAAVYARALKGEKLQGWNIKAFYNLGLIAEEVKNWDGASAIYTAIHKFNPNFMDVAKRLEKVKDILKKEKSSDDQTVPRFIVKQASEQEKEEKRERRYTLIEEIGRGGMGVVYKAFDNLLERYVALKVLPAYMQKEKGAVENFIKEAKATASLAHPNIVTVYDAGEQDGNYYIAMELVEGETLRDMIKRLGRINLKAFLVMAAQICKGISYAHSRGIIHRDIKPGNIMWTKDKLVKVMDLGLAKIIQDAANFHTVVGGTPHYMAPEQILGDKVTFATDIYSLGVTFFEMLTGTVPFPKGNVGYHHVHTPPPSPRKFNEKISPELERIILKCLEKDPEARYSNAHELYEDLKKCASV